MKKAIISVLSLFFIILIIAIVISRNVTPDFIKSEMSKQFYALTGRSLAVNGEIHWSFFPWLSINVQNVVINNNSDFSETPFAKADKVELAIKLMPLFANHVEIGNVSIDGLKLYLIKKANGQKNWEHLVSNGSSQTDFASKEKSNVKIHTFQIHSIRIEQSQVFFQNDEEHKSIELNHLNLTTKNISLNQPFALDVSFDFKRQPGSIVGDAAFNGTLNIFSDLTFSAQGRVQSHALPIGAFLFKNLQAVVDIHHGVISLNSIHANLYDGNYTGNISIDTKPATPIVTLNGTLTQANVSTLFTEFMHKNTSPFTGTVNLTTQLNFTTGSSDTMRKSLNGNVSVLLQNGVLHGINIPALIDLAQSFIKQKSPAKNANNQTDFGKLSATFQLKNGVMSNQDLTLQSSQLKATGQGDIDLVKQRINYKLSAGLVGHKEMIPIVIRGNLDSPVIAPDTEKVLKNATVDRLLNVVSGGDADEKNKLKQKLGKELKKLHLESLFR